ncbi:unnamed protein product [Hydatigera taeniaeformis]|uniref:Uncharacterized protein n=1 Tax=Hydatigena taeniaeformis TaxID=6205 RepID=A0A0R3XAF3_HYDTA|nr:unnamed protein product [Hydatigera taeniaeformis]
MATTDAATERAAVAKSMDEGADALGAVITEVEVEDDVSVELFLEYILCAHTPVHIMLSALVWGAERQNEECREGKIIDGRSNSSHNIDVQSKSRLV